MKPAGHEEWQPLFATGFDYPDKILKALRPRMVFDCGCNSGGYISTWLEYGAKEIHGFEPVPDMCEKAKQRYAGNPAVMIHRCGVGEKPEILKNQSVYNAWSLAPAGSRIDVAREYLQQPAFDVGIVPLDSWPGDPDFVKIDVDGYEYRVLLGMKRILKEVRPPIMFEFSHLLHFILGDDPGEMCLFIYDQGYKAVSVDGWVCDTPERMMTMYPKGSSYDIMLMPND